MKFVILAVALASLLGCEGLTEPNDPLREGLEISFVDHITEYGGVTVYGKQFGPRGTYGPDTLYWRIETLGDETVFGEGVEFPPELAVLVPVDPNFITTIYVSIWTDTDTFSLWWPEEQK